jgi:hypothetical protein
MYYVRTFFHTMNEVGNYESFWVLLMYWDTSFASWQFEIIIYAINEVN